jgi:hypothetical protein
MGLTHGIRPAAGGRMKVRLSTRERDLLRSLPDQLRPLLTGQVDVAGVRERLYPSAYADPEAEREYRDLIGTSLVDERMEKVNAFAQTLEGGTVGRLGWTLELDVEQAEAWLSALNDARLVLGAVVGIVDERRWEAGPDERDPNSVALYYLGWLQEELLAALTGSLPPRETR